MTTPNPVILAFVRSGKSPMEYRAWLDSCTPAGFHMVGWFPGDVDEAKEYLGTGVVMYYVYRPAAHVNRMFLGELDGKWFEMLNMPKQDFVGGLWGDVYAVAEPIDRYERRDDGAWAQVYAVRPTTDEERAAR